MMLDRFIAEFDHALRTLTGDRSTSTRPSPASGLEDVTLSEKERQHVGGLMRVNHAGEVCAQALYQGQALTAQLNDVREQMEHAATEEWDHLAWCEERLNELHSHTSYFNPIWYLGSFTIGAFAGLIGDRWSLAFVAETEHQVVHHLQQHQDSLPSQDHRTQAILAQMEQEEKTHGEHANQAGAADFPFAVHWLMNKMSKIMTTTSYYI